jgi:hypothetical protein
MFIRIIKHDKNTRDNGNTPVPNYLLADTGSCGLLSPFVLHSLFEMKASVMNWNSCRQRFGNCFPLSEKEGVLLNLTFRQIGTDSFSSLVLRSMP